MKKIALGIVSIAFALVGCSQMTVLRTEEMRNVGTDVQVAVLSNLDSAMHKLRADNKNLRKRVDSLKAELLAQQEASALLQKRMMAELTMLSRRVSDESERNDSRQEEIIYRLDMLLGKSDKILAKKVVVSGAPQPQISMDSVEREAERLVEAEAMFNTARSDYHRGEYKLAYTGFKQVYEQMKEGELGENSLYWMGLCLMDVNQVEKAKKVFEALAQSFPEGQKLCTTMFKLSAIYAAEGNVDMQKQYLQKILSSKTCATSGEFEQAAEILQELLEGNAVEPQPVSDSTAAPATETAPAAPAAEAPVAPAAEAPAAEAKPAEKTEAPAADKAEKPAKDAAPAEKKPAKKKKIPSAKKD
ncbi:MAG: tetratricopeptide repeat protein [Fibrobacter sp.]|uniref:tetratricopeptide repeat protein n=1 Tax=Fibrobacter sp. TaxID=35828 RepID=UPI0025BACB5A|nr:tetratricopeptide repeat protein [Fibrobacter sp.]MBQ9224931.1 tetratricopeptide repeat protein [Fibrobacter sp.]